MDHNTRVGVLLILSLSGCAPSSSLDVDTGTILGSLGDLPVETSAEYVGLNDQIVVVVWSDVVESSTVESTSSPDSASLRSESDLQDGGKLVWECDIAADGSRRLAIDGNQYDLAGGCIFLVSTTGRSVKVQQLDRGTIAVGNIDQRIRELTRDEEVAAFFSEKSPAGGTNNSD